MRSHKKTHFIFSRVGPISPNPGAISPPGFAKTVGRHQYSGVTTVVEAGRVVGQENTQSHVSVSLTDCQRQEQTPSDSPQTLYKSFINCVQSVFFIYYVSQEIQCFIYFAGD